MPERSDPQSRIRKSWDDNADAWTRAVREERIASRLAGTNDAVRDAVDAVQASRILDVGCGEGWLSHLFARDGCAVTGFDGSADLIAAARTGPGCFIHLDYGAFMNDPSAVGGDFDAAVCNFSLFDEDLTPMLTALGSRLTRDGALIIQTVHPAAEMGENPYTDGWRAESFQTLGAGFREMPWFYRTVGSWINVLYGAGFVVVRCTEPVSEQTGRPLSIVLLCKRAAVK